MGIGVSVFLLAVGAIMAFALNADVEGVELDTVGIILMVVGALGLLVSLVFASSISGRRATDTVVREERY